MNIVNRKSFGKNVPAACLLLAAITLLVAGCQTTTEQSQRSGKDAAQLWANTCMRCHNPRPPGAYSDGQWEVAMLHMRLRANLTAEEHKKILEFLKSAN